MGAITQSILQRLGLPLRASVQWYLSKPRKYRYKHIAIRVLPGVFHPGFFFSTRIILDFLSTQDLARKSFLEMGCGSGLISIFAADKGALVTACDINSKAIENTKQNSKIHNVEITVTASDLFQNIDGKFDWIVINPPYYPTKPKKEEEYAWYCGEEHEYFERFFHSLSTFTHAESKVLMILSDVCDLEKIFSIASKNEFQFEKILEKKVWADGLNYLYWIKKSDRLS